MVNYYITVNGHLTKTDGIEKGCWVCMIHPTEEELERVSGTLSIEPDLLRAALDEEERSRIEIEGGASLILVDVPTVEMEDKDFAYSTIPLGIVQTGDALITVCLKDSHILKDFAQERVKEFYTNKRTRFILQILYRNASRFLLYLRQIDKKTNTVEAQLQKSLRNKELIQLLRLEKSLVFFNTSLKGNEIVLEKLLRTDLIRRFPDDEDLLEDVIVENKQAIEMCTIYRDILQGTMDTFASIISNNVNDIMKVLTSLTLILAVPTLIASLWGMNVAVPFTHNPWGFWILIGVSSVASLLSAFLLGRRKML